MKSYSIKVALRGVSPMIWRRLRITGDTPLASLHYMIQIVSEWYDYYLHQFHIYGQDYAIPREGGVWCEDARTVRIDDFEFDVGDRFTYEYNFFAQWLFDIRIETIAEHASGSDPPVCLSGRGMPGITKYDEYEKVQILAEEIVKYQKTITIGDMRCLLEELDTVRFNRGKSNQRLAALDPHNPTIDHVIVIGCPWRDDHEIQYSDQDLKMNKVTSK